MGIRGICLLIVVWCVWWNVFGGEYEIKGVVIEKCRGEGLEFVNVVVVGVGMGGCRDGKGNFVMSEVGGGI